MGIIIISTYPDKKSVSKIADVVVSERLAACVNYTKINSIYAWKGTIEYTEEFLTLFKTSNKTKRLLKKKITQLHPYEVPEIVELKMDDASQPYLRWLEDSTWRKSKKRNNSAKR